MSFWDLPTATHLKQLLLCEQLKDLHNSNNLLRPHTPLPEMNQIVTDAKIKYKNDNFEKHMKKTWIVQKIVKNKRNLLWCCRAPVASDRVEETWPSVANCRAWSSWSDDIQTLLTQKQIKNLPDIHHEEDQITLTMSPNS